MLADLGPRLGNAGKAGVQSFHILILQPIKRIRERGLLRELRLAPGPRQTEIGAEQQIGLRGGTATGQDQHQTFHQLIGRRVRNGFDGQFYFRQRLQDLGAPQRLAQRS